MGTAECILLFPHAPKSSILWLCVDGRLLGRPAVPLQSASIYLRQVLKTRGSPVRFATWWWWNLVPFKVIETFLKTSSYLRDCRVVLHVPFSPLSVSCKCRDMLVRFPYRYAPFRLTRNWMIQSWRCLSQYNRLLSLTGSDDRFDLLDILLKPLIKKVNQAFKWKRHQSTYQIMRRNSSLECQESRAAIKLIPW